MRPTSALVRPATPPDSTSRPAAASPRTPAPGTRPAPPRWRADDIRRDARRRAAAILEVLAGVRTPVEAAQQLDISVARYDSAEGRAVQGLGAACAPRPRGRGRNPDSDLAAWRRVCDQLRRQGARLQALLRVAPRTVGLASAPASAATPGRAGEKKRRPRQPTARALQAAAALPEAEAAAAAPPAGDPAASP